MWKAFAEHFRECGRNGTLFVFAVLGVMAGALFVSAAGTPVVTALWVTWTALFIRAGLKFIDEWRHPARLGRMPPLSQNDLSTARSKLMKYRAQRLR